MKCRASERADQRGERSGIALRRRLAHRQHLLRHARHDRAAEMQDTADAGFHRHRIPRRADAEAVDLPVGEAVDHIRRRQHHQPHILVRIDAAGRHPEPQLVIMVGEREGHAKGEDVMAARLAFGDDRGKRARRHQRIGDIAVCGIGPRLEQPPRQRDGIPFSPIKGLRSAPAHGRCRDWAILPATAGAAASNRPILSLSRTFDHDTSRTSSMSSPCAAAKPWSTATSSAAASTSGMKPMRSLSLLI